MQRIVSRVGQTNSTAMHGKAGPGSGSRSSPRSSGNCLPRQAHREDSLLFVRSHLDRAAVSCGDLGGNVQPRPRLPSCAAPVFKPRWSGSNILRSSDGSRPHRYSHFEPDFRLVACHHHPHGRVMCSIPDRIHDEVAQQLLQASTVPDLPQTEGRVEHDPAVGMRRWGGVCR